MIVNSDDGYNGDYDDAERYQYPSVLIATVVSNPTMMSAPITAVMMIVYNPSYSTTLPKSVNTQNDGSESLSNTRHAGAMQRCRVRC